MGGPLFVPFSYYTSFLECLKQLWNLKALRLIIYSPYMDPIYDQDEQSFNTESCNEELQIILAARMQQLADHMFSQLDGHCPKLTALLIEARWNEPEESFLEEGPQRWIEYFGYLRATRMGPCNREEVMACPVDVAMIKHHEPCSDIFYNRVVIM
jgi:hypothetical protein